MSDTMTSAYQLAETIKRIASRIKSEMDAGKPIHPIDRELLDILSNMHQRMNALSNR